MSKPNIAQGLIDREGADDYVGDDDQGEEQQSAFAAACKEVLDAIRKNDLQALTDALDVAIESKK